jgi:glycosyl transferase family 25
VSYDDTVTADDKISEMTSHKMVLHPFMSIQRDFGYSDVTQSNNMIPGKITRHFDMAHHRLQACADAYKRYLNK